MVVYFAGDGQLGNQIFQYMLLRSRFRRSYIVSRNCLEIKELFSNVSRVINIKKMNKSKFLTRCFRKLINLRIIGHCYVERTEYFGFPVEANMGDLIVVKGLLPFYYSELFFAQSENMFSCKIRLKIRDNIKNSAQKIISRFVVKNKSIGFVHVRRGDYLVHSVLGGVPVSLSLQYYYDAIMSIEKNHSSSIFWIILSDDISYVEEKFELIKNKVVLQNSKYIDFAIMSLCEYGVLSNSTFSWWASYFMDNRKACIAPKDWMGWRISCEYPKHISPSWCDLIKVIEGPFE